MKSLGKYLQEPLVYNPIKGMCQLCFKGNFLAAKGAAREALICGVSQSVNITCTKPNLVVHTPYTDNDLINISDFLNLKITYNDLVITDM